MTKKLISVVIPAYNEEDCVHELARRLRLVFDIEDDYLWEALFVENGSSDGSWSMLQQIHREDNRFKVVRLARNFRMDGGLTAGLHFVSGDACVLMTADLQDPPEMIPLFLRKWEQGVDNVYAEISKRRGTGFLRAVSSTGFYWLANKMTAGTITNGASDFRLIDKRVYEVVKTMDERNRFLRGLVGWVGFESAGIPMERPERFAGDSKADTGKVLTLAINGILAHSTVPLRAISFAGLLISAVATGAFLVNGILWISQGVPFNGFGTLFSLLILLIGLVSVMLGVLSEYVGLVYDEVKRRPNFVVSDTLGDLHE